MLGDSFKEGTFIAVTHDEWTDEPIIGRVLTTGERKCDIEIRWYDGTYRRKWRASRERKNGQYIPWVSHVKGSQVLLNFTMEVIEEFRLEQHIVDELKAAYKRVKKT